MNFKIFVESSLDDLFRSAVSAYPKTQRRQYATDTIRLASIDWIPFLGMRTLFIKGLIQNEGKEYTSHIIFKNVRYFNHATPETITLIKEGREYYLEQLSNIDTDVLTRCSCPDYKWRFKYWNHLDNSLYGSKGKRYESKGVGPPANPLEMPGMCKHLMVLARILRQEGIVNQ